MQNLSSFCVIGSTFIGLNPEMCPIKIKGVRKHSKGKQKLLPKHDLDYLLFAECTVFELWNNFL